MNASVYLVNGKTNDTVQVSDRAIQFGDGLFETLRIHQSQACYLHRHMTRLRNGCQRLYLEGVDFVSLQAELQALAGQTEEGVLKLMISRGNSTRGYRIVPDTKPTIILGLHPPPVYSDELRLYGIRARICSLRLARQPALAGIKHLNRLEQVLARAEWEDEDIHEGLLLDTSDQLVEGTMSNLFVGREGKLYTPDLQFCGVSGVMRSVIIDVSESLGIDISIAGLSLADVRSADELFVSNCVTGIRPIRRIDGIRNYPVGPLTRQLKDAVRLWDDMENERWYSK